MKREKRDYSAGYDRRKYIRLDSVFPVSFKLMAIDGKTPLSDWVQGFTNNIGKGGICLAVNNLNPQLAKYIKNQQAKLSLGIEMPITKTPVSALVKVIWVKEFADNPNKYFIGLAYEEIDPAKNNLIMRYARAKKIFLPSVLTIIIILGLLVTLNTYLNIKLIRGNKALVEQLVKILQESSVAKQRVKEIAREREDLQLKIQTLQARIQTVEKEKLDDERNALIENLTKERDSLQEQLISLQHKENSVTEELLRLDKKKVQLAKANFDKMYDWLRIHQNPHTGLVMSFEGDGDITNWAFIYDQSLVAQAYIYFGDFAAARKIFDFFNGKAKRTNRLFYNAYYCLDGSPAEYIVHSGPNIWLGIAILQYTHKAQDKHYLGLAEEIAETITDLQNQDKEGGIRGGPDLSWYSTEHNLDAYAFFDMLYRITQKPSYRKARDKALNWLVEHTYDKQDIPIQRGKGDSTIATDTYAWSLAAVGPEKLEALGMNPDRIIEFAEQNCSAEVDYVRPEGKSIKVKGFDFASQRNLARGGVISSEWTAQMVLAFKIMGEFYHKKDMLAKTHAYEMKADRYLSELGKMIISSPSPSGQGESCLPYATQDLVDTGHGWMTPKGKSTGSVSATAYTLFAYYNYNPLELEE